MGFYLAMPGSTTAKIAGKEAQTDESSSSALLSLSLPAQKASAESTAFRWDKRQATRHEAVLRQSPAPPLGVSIVVVPPSSTGAMNNNRINHSCDFEQQLKRLSFFPCFISLHCLGSRAHPIAPVVVLLIVVIIVVVR